MSFRYRSEYRKEITAYQYKNGDVYRVKGVEQIFCPLSLNEAAFAVVHIDRDKGKAGLPFVIEPAASHNGLCRLVHTEKIEKNNKNKTAPAIIRIEFYGNQQKSQDTKKLFLLIFPEVFKSPDCKISQKQGEKYILFFCPPGVRMHIIPGDFRNQCEEKEISGVFKPVSGMQKPFDQKETENGKGYPSDISADPIEGISLSV